MAPKPQIARQLIELIAERYRECVPSETTAET